MVNERESREKHCWQWLHALRGRHVATIGGHNGKMFVNNGHDGGERFKVLVTLNFEGLPGFNG